MEDFESFRDNTESKTVANLDPFSLDPVGEKWRDISPVVSESKESDLSLSDDDPLDIDCKCTRCPLNNDAKNYKCCRDVKLWQKEYATEGIEI